MNYEQTIVLSNEVHVIYKNTNFNTLLKDSFYFKSGLCWMYQVLVKQTSDDQHLESEFLEALVFFDMLGLKRYASGEWHYGTSKSSLS